MALFSGGTFGGLVVSIMVGRELGCVPGQWSYSLLINDVLYELHRDIIFTVSYRVLLFHCNNDTLMNYCR